MARTQLPKSFAKVFSAVHARVYKITGGRIGSKISDGEIVLLTTIGRKTGGPRTKPLIAINHRGGWVVVGSFGGHDGLTGRLRARRAGFDPARVTSPAPAHRMSSRPTTSRCQPLVSSG